MTKPWDNEPTPIIDGSDMYYPDTAIEAGRNIERRMRAAERLLEKAQYIYGLWYISGVTEHLEAARKEDEK